MYEMKRTLCIYLLSSKKVINLSLYLSQLIYLLNIFMRFKLSRPSHMGLKTLWFCASPNEKEHKRQRGEPNGKSGSKAFNRLVFKIFQLFLKHFDFIVCPCYLWIFINLFYFFISLSLRGC